MKNYIEETVKIGSVDGVSGKKSVSVDGFGMDIEKEILDLLKEKISG